MPHKLRNRADLVAVARSISSSRHVARGALRLPAMLPLMVVGFVLSPAMLGPAVLGPAGLIAQQAPVVAGSAATPLPEPPEDDDPTGAAGAEELRQIEALVDQLGSGSFAQREAATAQLLRLGVKVLPALKRREGTGDAELRQRIEVLSKRLMEDDFEKRIVAFLRGDTEATLPGWNYVRGQLQDQPGMRDLFVVMTRRRGGVVPLLDGSGQDRKEALAILVKEIDDQRMRIGFEPHVADALLLLMLATDEGNTPSATPTDILVTLYLRRHEVGTGLTDPLLGTPLRRLIAKWFDNCSPAAHLAAFALALDRGLVEITSLAKRVIRTAAEENDMQKVEYAILTLCRFGTPEDSPLLMTLMDDKRLVNEEYLNVDSSGRTLVVQVRDLALATIARLHQQGLREVGFPAGQDHPVTGFASDSVGFPEGPAGEDARGRVRQTIEELLAQGNGDSKDGDSKDGD